MPKTIRIRGDQAAFVEDTRDIHSTSIASAVFVSVSVLNVGRCAESFLELHCRLPTSNLCHFHLFSRIVPSDPPVILFEFHYLPYASCNVELSRIFPNDLGGKGEIGHSRSADQPADRVQGCNHSYQVPIWLGFGY